MPIKSRNFVLTKGYPAAAAITKKLAVKFVGDGTQAVTPVTAVTDKIAGIAEFSISAGEITKVNKVTVAVEGRAKMTGSAAIVEGALVTITATGQAVTAVSGSRVIGTCDEPCAGAGLDCSVRLSLSGLLAP